MGLLNPPFKVSFFLPSKWFSKWGLQLALGKRLLWGRQTLILPDPPLWHFCVTQTVSNWRHTKFKRDSHLVWDERPLLVAPAGGKSGTLYRNHLFVQTKMKFIPGQGQILGQDSTRSHTWFILEISKSSSGQIQGQVAMLGQTLVLFYKSYYGLWIYS